MSVPNGNLLPRRVGASPCRVACFGQLNIHDAKQPLVPFYTQKADRFGLGVPLSQPFELLNAKTESPPGKIHGTNSNHFTCMLITRPCRTNVQGLEDLGRTADVLAAVTVLSSFCFGL